MNTTLVLAGSGEFTDAMIDTDQSLLEIAKNRFKLRDAEKVRVAIVPTAAGEEASYEQWFLKGKSHFEKLGAQPVKISVVHKGHTEDIKLIEELQKAHVIYFSGGNPGYLFHTLQQTPVWATIESLYENGVILAGSSAGAMIMGKYVLSNAQKLTTAEPKPLWEKAFNVVPFAILPHYDFVMQKMKDVFEKTLAQTPQAIQDILLGIDEDTAVIIDENHKALIKGRGNVYVKKNREMVVFEAGSSLVLY